MSELKSDLTETTRKRFALDQLPRSLRYGALLPLLGGLSLLGVRKLEAAATYRPERYAPGAEWPLPENAEDVWFNSRDGVRLHGWFVRAANALAKATVLYCHGNAGNIARWGPFAGTLAAHGFDVLLFDYRGYGRSAGAIINEHCLYTDADAAYDYLQRERGVRHERLVLYGLSLGTTAAIDLAARRRCAALVVESGLSSASDMGAHTFPWLPRLLHRLARNRFESTRKIAQVNCPVLVTHGTADPVIPVEQGHKLFTAAREPKRLLIVEGGDHNLPGYGGAGYLSSVVEFLGASLTGMVNEGRELLQAR